LVELVDHLLLLLKQQVQLQKLVVLHSDVCFKCFSSLLLESPVVNDLSLLVLELDYFPIQTLELKSEVLPLLPRLSSLVYQKAYTRLSKSIYQKTQLVVGTL
jgi:hypothetical protein